MAKAGAVPGGSVPCLQLQTELHQPFFGSHLSEMRNLGEFCEKKGILGSEQLSDLVSLPLPDTLEGR